MAEGKLPFRTHCCSGLAMELGYEKSALLHLAFPVGQGWACLKVNYNCGCITYQCKSSFATSKINHIPRMEVLLCLLFCTARNIYFCCEATRTN